VADVTIRISAESAEALARIKAFSQGIQESFRQVKAGDPVLASSAVKVRDLSAAQGEATRASQAWQTAVKAGDPVLASSAVKVRDLSAAKGEATRASQAWQTALSQLPGPLGEISGRTQTWIRLLRGPAGLVVGLGAVATAAIGLAKSLVNDIERLDNLSRQTGLAIGSLQAFEQAAREAGEAPETLAMGFGRVNQAIADFLQGKESAAKGFEAIGVAFGSLVTSGANVEDILEATAKALAAIPDPTHRAAAQMDLFGVRGKAMSTVLDTIAREGLAAYTQGMRDAGIVTSEETNRMAREIDAMADRFDRAVTGWITRVKAFAVESVLSAVTAIERILAAAGLGVHEIVRPGLLTAPTTARPEPAPSTEALRRDAEEFRRLTAEAQRDAAEFLRLTADYRRALQQMDLDEMTAGFDRARQAIADFVPSLDRTLRLTEDYAFVLPQTNQELEFNMQLLTDQAEASDRAASGYTALMESLGLTAQAFTLAQGSLTNFDAALARGQALAEGASGSVERLAQTARSGLLPVLGVELPSAAERFGTGFADVSERITESFATWEAQGRLTAQNLYGILQDGFFTILRGDLDDLDDVWKRALDAVLAQIAAFLAAEAVSELLRVVKNIANLGGDGSREGGSSTEIGDTGVDAGDLIEIGTTILNFFQEQNSRTLHLAESTRQLRQEVERLGEAYRDVGTGVGNTGPAPGSPTGFTAITGFDLRDAMKSFANLSILGPGIAAVAGLVGGLEADGKSLRDRAIDALKDLIDRAFDLIGIDTAFGPTTQARNAILGMAENEAQLGIAAQNAAQVAAQTAAAATNFAGDLDILGGGLTDASRASAQTASETKGFSVELDMLGREIANAATAAGQAAEQAGQAARDALEAADRATEAAAEARGAADGADRGPGDTAPDMGGPGGFGAEPFQRGGWVTGGVWDRDSVMAAVARGEFIVNNRVTRMPGVAAGLEHLNATGRWPGRVGDGADLVAALAGLSADGPATVALLRRIAEALERRPARLAGSPLA
jgi:hypothetical protein